MTTVTDAPAQAAEAGRGIKDLSRAQWSDAQLAAWNALKIASSLMVTWGVALMVRFALPRTLGPELYGVFNFADAFAMGFFVISTLGVETYVSKEVSVRFEHASEFFFGTLVARTAVTALLLGVMAAVLQLTHRPPVVQQLVFAFAVGQFFYVTNSTFASMLQARGTVDGLSLVNVVTKALWGAGILFSLWQGLPLIALAVSFSVAEFLKSCALFTLCRRHLGLELRADFRTAFQVLGACLPFYVTNLSITLATKVDVTLIGFLTTDKEVGLYGVASNLAQLALLLTPLISAVLLPLFARARARSEDDLTETIRRSLEIILSVAIPTSLALGIGADVWVHWVGGGRFDASATALRVLSPVFVLTYVGMMCASCLNLLKRAWTVTAVCMVGMVVNPALNLMLIRPMEARLGEGGAGVGAALAVIGSELISTALMLMVIGRRTIDRRVISTVLRTLAVCALVLLLDRTLAGLGAWRIPVDAVAYIGLALAFRAVRVDEIQTFFLNARAARRG